MFNLTKKGLILILINVAQVKNCLLLKDQKCDVKKVIIDNNYMTFSYKIKVDKCVESCNDVNNPYFKVFVPDIVKNVNVKVFDLFSQKNILKTSLFIKAVSVIVY